MKLTTTIAFLLSAMLTTALPSEIPADWPRQCGHIQDRTGARNDLVGDFGCRPVHFTNFAYQMASYCSCTFHKDSTCHDNVQPVITGPNGTGTTDVNNGGVRAVRCWKYKG
ncbi:hypothetical protein M011DRAFT_467737 [Sporormia fimetaria CBS 119925]|uniref:Uncharacterized protein n=1 Tax=Sporormia fimetaria CBS 119925 TaxID=1340428 RepID=A0A6A6V9K8_9PLEO|nr:hypothetical protein M011DRAFT_467737 [Sporormia fimetaria CBS 119925]